jgi:NAD(P)-dependent dehydrogenase (short-subunit alcohol dehydrogenase family)
VVASVTAYSLAKAGILAFTQALHREFGSDGTKATALSPAFVATDMTQALPIAPEEMIQPEDVAEGVRFVLRTSRHAVVSEVRIIRPADPLVA